MNATGRLLCAGLAALFAACGCSSPNAANIQLRKDNQSLASRIDDLNRRNAALTAQIAAVQSTNSIPTLPESRLDRLFTTHGLTLDRLTSGYSADPNTPDQMVKVYAVPTDDDGQPFKAAGRFTVELLDLAAPDKVLGHWEFSTDQSRALWYGHALLYTYVLDCAWQKLPQHHNLLVNVTFTDELTGRQFTAHADVTVNPPATQPAS